jgi:hypothetical protein
MIWREKRILLFVLGLLLAANTIFFFTYRVQYQARLREMDERQTVAETALAQARATRVRGERQLAAYRQIEKDVARVYNEHWATQGERLTAMIGEVKRLAVASSLVPKAYSFRRSELTSEATARESRSASSSGTARRMPETGATEVGISFTVDGTYQQVRRLINLLELSRQFVIIDGISLSSREGNALSLQLQLKTLFRDTSLPQQAANRRL